MQIIRKKRWEIAEREATPEALFLNRRAMLVGMGAAGLGATGLSSPAFAQASANADALFPYPNNPAFTIERPLTSEMAAASYNNFYEFGLSKAVAKAAQALETRPWISGGATIA